MKDPKCRIYKEFCLLLYKRCENVHNIYIHFQPFLDADLTALDHFTRALFKKKLNTSKVKGVHLVSAGKEQGEISELSREIILTEESLEFRMKKLTDQFRLIRLRLLVILRS